MRDILDALKALADENRLRILYALRDGELCVCQVIALLDLAPSTVSRHLSVLRSARWVESRKDGRWMYYRLSSEFRFPSADKVLRLLFEDMKQAKSMIKDGKQIEKIRSEDMEALCKRLFCKT